MASPIVPSEGVLLGRARIPGIDHPRIVTVRGEDVVDITAKAAPTSRDIAELDDPAGYVASAPGKPIGKLQNTRFTLAEMATEAYVARTFVNHCVEQLNKGEVDTALASMAKWWTTELQKKIVDQGVQMHGGYGYMMEYPIAKAYADTRIQTIYGGTTEIQKEIIGRFLGL